MKGTILTALLLCSALMAMEPFRTISGFSQPESVLFDSVQNRYYVSNVNGVPNEKDGNGFISIMSSDSIETVQWITGLNAPKGMGLTGDRLFVADIDELVEISVHTGKIVTRYRGKGAQFLNDVTVSDNGDVFVSDMLGNAIYRLHEGKFQIWLEDISLPNGLCFQKRRLIVATWGTGLQPTFETETPGTVLSVNCKTKEVSPAVQDTQIGNLDGIVAVGKRRYIATDYMAGKVLEITSEKSSEIITVPHGSADLWYNSADKLLLIPSMAEGTVMIFSL